MRDRPLQLQLWAAAGVKISTAETANGRLTRVLKTFWTECAKDLLNLLSDWLRSGAAATLQRKDLPLSAVKHIRSERTKKPSTW
jgi:hypothetical protein